MGAALMKNINLEWDDIFSISQNHITFYTDRNKLDVSTLYFSPDVKELQYNMINDAQHNNKSSKLYYHDRYVHCVVVDDHACSSKLATQNSFGWSYIEN